MCYAPIRFGKTRFAPLGVGTARQAVFGVAKTRYGKTRLSDSFRNIMSRRSHGRTTHMSRALRGPRPSGSGKILCHAPSAAEPKHVKRPSGSKKPRTPRFAHVGAKMHGTCTVFATSTCLSLRAQQGLEPCFRSIDDVFGVLNTRCGFLVACKHIKIQVIERG